jgi:hypothetical protein
MPLDKRSMVRQATKNPQTDKVEQLLRQIVRAERRTERREDERIPIAIVVAIVPSIGGRPDSQAAFVTLTKNISADGISVVVNKRMPTDEMFIGFPSKTGLDFVKAQVLHREKMALGCQKLGLKMQELVDVADFPELNDIDCYEP